MLVGDGNVPGHHTLPLAVGVYFVAVNFAFAGETGADGVANPHRFDEPQGVQPIVGQHRPGRWRDKQPCSRRQHKVPVCNPFAKR